MALGYLGLDYISKVLPYNDEETPQRLTGKKMLPILTMDGKNINESLDIIALVDTKDLLKVRQTMGSAEFHAFEKLLNQLGGPIHSLAMPYWIYTAEFNESSRKYFQSKKEEKRGPFKDLIKNQKMFYQELQPKLDELELSLIPFYQSEHFSLYDILLASHLWGLYVVPEFQFSAKIHLFLQRVKEICHFDYHKDYWR
jgi:glutaredoxin 2